MICLYKKGNTHIVRGVNCTLERFKPDDLDYALSLGYVVDPTQIGKAPTKEQADTNKSGKLSNKEVREAAKLAGIDNYSKARISNLKKELGYEE